MVMRIVTRMEKNKKLLFIIGVLIIAVVLGGVGYLVFFGIEEVRIEDPDKPSTQQPVDKADGFIVKEVKKVGDDIREVIEITMNGKTKEMELVASIKNSYDYAEIKMMYGEEIFYSKSLEGSSGIEELKKEYFTEEGIRKEFNDTNMRFVNGTDGKKYLLVSTSNDHFVMGASSELYIFNDELERLGNDLNFNGCNNDKAMTILPAGVGYASFEEPGKSGYKDTFGVCKSDACYLTAKIEGNKIYYLKANIKDSAYTGGEIGEYEERVYTIHENKLNYTVKGRYKITDIAGQAC